MRLPPSIPPKQRERECPDTQLFRQATLPLTFAVRAGRGSRLILTCRHLASAADPCESATLHVHTGGHPVAVLSTFKS
jgi:hypothetical protein